MQQQYKVYNIKRLIFNNRKIFILRIIAPIQVLGAIKFDRLLCNFLIDGILIKNIILTLKFQIYLLSISLSLLSCKSSKIGHNNFDNARYDTIRSCSQKWQFLSIDTTVSIKVLAYLPAFHVDLTLRPAMIVGVTTWNDTIRVLQYGFEKDLKIGKLIEVKPDTSIDINNSVTKALVQRDLPIILSKSKTFNRYYCDVTKTYFGKVND